MVSLDKIRMQKRARRPSFCRKQLWQSKSWNPFMFIMKFKISRPLKMSSCMITSQLEVVCGSMECMALNRSMISNVILWKTSAVYSLFEWKMFSEFLLFKASN